MILASANVNVIMVVVCKDRKGLVCSKMKGGAERARGSLVATTEYLRVLMG